MIDLDTEICGCNSLTVRDIAICMKENNFTSFEELLKNSECPIGDKCEACHLDGFHNDGINIPMVVSLVNQKKIKVD
jgi:hypothetical protein